MANEYQVVFRGTNAGQAMQHVRYYRAYGVPGNSDIQNFADELGTQFINAYVDLIPTNCQYVDLYIRPNIVGALGASVVPASFPFTGNQIGEALPPYATTNVRLRSGGISLPNKGLVQLPAPTEAHQTAGVIVPGDFPDYQTAAPFWSMIIEPTIGRDWTPILYNRSGNVYNDLVIASTLPNLGTQAQRKYGRGN